MSLHNHQLITKVSVQSLLQQVQQAEILLTFGDTCDAKFCLTLKDHMAKMRAQLNDLEYRLEQKMG